MTDKHSIHDRVTATILQQIEASPGDPVMPWHRPAGSALHIPKNATTASAYRGINILMLWIAADMKQYPTGLWASYKQWVRRVSRMKGVTSWVREQCPALSPHPACRAGNGTV